MRAHVNRHAGVRVIVLAALSFACGDAGTTVDPATRCGWAEPHRLFTPEAGEHVGAFGPSTDIRERWHDIPRELFFSTSDNLYSSGYCGEDLAPMRAGDGRWHLHEGLALDCGAGVVLRGPSDDELVPVLEGAYCSWLVTPEGILGFARAEGTDRAIPLRLIDFRAPELPVMALSDEPVLPLARHVGPRDFPSITGTNDRLQTGHFSSPYLMLTASGTVLHVDRDTWTTTPVLHDVAELLPAPDGQAFAYRPRLADDTPGDMRVHVLATGSEFVAASADEIYHWPSPWWSVDGSIFAVSIEVVGGDRDRVLSLPSGTPALSPPRTHVQRELDDGGLWLADWGDIQRESYWEPLSGELHTLYDHVQLPPGYRRAAADGLELINLPQPVGFTETPPGTLIHLPWDGSKGEVLAEDIYPWYRRLADGRIVTTRPTSDGFKGGDPVDLVLITGDGERVIDRQVILLGSLLPSDGEPYMGYFRIIGDLLLYAVRDDAGGRSGVWAVNLSQL